MSHCPVAPYRAVPCHVVSHSAVKILVRDAAKRQGATRHNYYCEPSQCVCRCVLAYVTKPPCIIAETCRRYNYIVALEILRHFVQLVIGTFKNHLTLYHTLKVVCTKLDHTRDRVYVRW